MLDENVVQPLLVTTSALNLATECVRMILKVLSAAPCLSRLDAYCVCRRSILKSSRADAIWLRCCMCVGFISLA